MYVSTQSRTVIVKMRSGDEISEAEMEMAGGDGMPDLDNIGGYTISQYVVLQSIMALLYFIAKCLLMTDESLKKANDNYDDSSWRSWVNTHNLLVMYILTCSMTMSNSVLRTVKLVIAQGEGDRLGIFAKLGCFILFTDLLGSFIMICIKC